MSARDPASGQESPVPALPRRTVLATAVAAAATAHAATAAQPGSEATTPDGPAEAVRDRAPRAADVVLLVNGEERRLPGLDVRTTLLDSLRERLRLTGTKKGCGLGQCGACTVLLDGQRIKSCLALAARCEGRAVTTIKGLAEGDELHPLQAAFVAHDAFQCGYCTPGQLLSGVACIAEGHAGSAEEVREWMSGNLCRCGAYANIVAAIAETAQAQAAASPAREG